MSRIAPMFAFLSLVVALAGEAAFLFPRLPTRIATHFDASGAPNGFGCKEMLMRDGAMTLALLVVVFLAVGIIDYLPADTLKYPGTRRLSGAEAKAARAYICDWTRWFLVLTMALLATVFGRVLVANLSPAPRLGNEMFGLLGAYLALSGAMLFVLIRHFQT